MLTGAQAEGAAIPEDVVMETAIVEAGATELAVEAVIATTLGSGTIVAPEASAEARIKLHPEASTQVVIREAMIEDVAPLRSVPMLETGSSSHTGLELLDNDLIDPAFVSLSMESWHWMEN
jgi:hypothetical protein